MAQTAFPEACCRSLCCTLSGMLFCFSPEVDAPICSLQDPQAGAPALGQQQVNFWKSGACFPLRITITKWLTILGSL